MKHNHAIPNPNLDLITLVLGTGHIQGGFDVAAMLSLVVEFIRLMGDSIGFMIGGDSGKADVGDKGRCADFYQTDFTALIRTQYRSSYFISLEPKQLLRSGWCAHTYIAAPT